MTRQYVERLLVWIIYNLKDTNYIDHSILHFFNLLIKLYFIMHKYWWGHKFILRVE